MAHDLNNALAPVLLGTQLLRRKSGDDDDKKLLSLIETSTNQGKACQVVLHVAAVPDRMLGEPELKDGAKPCNDHREPRADREVAQTIHQPLAQSALR